MINICWLSRKRQRAYLSAANKHHERFALQERLFFGQDGGVEMLIKAIWHGVGRCARSSPGRTISLSTSGYGSINMTRSARFAAGAAQAFPPWYSQDAGQRSAAQQQHGAQPHISMAAAAARGANIAPRHISHEQKRFASLPLNIASGAQRYATLTGRKHGGGGTMTLWLVVASLRIACAACTAFLRARHHAVSHLHAYLHHTAPLRDNFAHFPTRCAYIATRITCTFICCALLRVHFTRCLLRTLSASSGAAGLCAFSALLSPMLHR